MWGFTVRGSWRSNITAIFWTPLLWPSTLCLSRSPGLLKRKAWSPLCWVLAFFTASYQHLLWTPIHQGPKPLRPGVAFPTTSSPLEIVRRPLDLWNRMFNCHQAEITAMQFTDHSLPVHQFMSVPWEFF